MQIRLKKHYFGQFTVKLNHKLMGFIPIFVALSGLILLYCIYTYNQIKPRKLRINQVIEQMAANSSQRKQMIFTFDENTPNSPLSGVAKILRKSSTDRFQSVKKEQELIELIDASLNDLRDEELKSELQRSNEAQKKLLKNLSVFARDYNAMIEKAPAKFLAAVFGFKTF